MSIISRTADTFYAFRFIRLLTTPWEKTGAYKAGIIDKDGKILRKAVSSEDRSVYNYFHRLVFNIKRLLNRVPLGRTTVASYLAALFLIKEATGLTDDEIKNILVEASDISEFPKIPLNESDLIIREGTYMLRHDIPLMKTGETLAYKNTHVMIEDVNPVGYIFDQPHFQALHLLTQQEVVVNINDLDI
jgi:hypothetical protein